MAASSSLQKAKWCLVLSLTCVAGSARSDVRTCDFDGDGVDDLLIGVYEENAVSVGDAGCVHAIYGAVGSGLTSGGNQMINQDSAGILDACEASDLFSGALAVGDVNGDGRDDAIIGIPREEIGSPFNVGALSVILGAEGTGLSSLDQFFTEDSTGVEDSAEDSDQFGTVVCVGNFNGDPFDDVAVGVPYEDVGSITNAGQVHVFYGSASALRTSNDQLWNQDTSGIYGGCEFEDRFGWAVSSGDYNGDGYDDLAISAIDEDYVGLNDGVVHVIYGSSSGLSSAGNQLWSQDGAGVLGTASDYDEFGHALCSADFNRDGRDDLAIGSGWDDDAGDRLLNSGTVNILYGSFGSGLTSAPPTGDPTAIYLSQQLLGTETDEQNDNFGDCLSAGDFNGDGFDDLAIGHPGESVGSLVGAGAVSISYGSASGLTKTGAKLLHQDIAGMSGACNAGDGFGHALTTGDFNADGFSELVVGVPFETVSALVAAGAVQVIPGSGTGLITTGNRIWTQNTVNILENAETNDLFGWSLPSR